MEALGGKDSGEGALYSHRACQPREGSVRQESENNRDMRIVRGIYIYASSNSKDSDGMTEQKYVAESLAN